MENKNKILYIALSAVFLIVIIVIIFLVSRVNPAEGAPEASVEPSAAVTSTVPPSSYTAPAPTPTPTPTEEIPAITPPAATAVNPSSDSDIVLTTTPPSSDTDIPEPAEPVGSATPEQGFQTADIHQPNSGE